MLLAAHDHAPSGPPLIPISPEDYYAAQAWFAPFVVLVAFALQVLLVRAILATESAVTIAGLGVSVPILVLWVCGDLVAFGLGGFETMQSATRFIVPLALLGVLTLVAILAKRSGTTTARALGTAVALLLVRGVVFAPFMR